MTTNFFRPSLLLLFWDPRYIPDPQHCGAQVDRYNITITSVNLNSLNILAKLEPKSARTLEGQLSCQSSVTSVIFLGLLDTDPLVRGTDPNPFIIKQK